jgi:glycerophosphoryl diester phosphodiesterase
VRKLDSSLAVFLNTNVSPVAAIPVLGLLPLRVLCRKSVRIGCCGLNIHHRFFSKQLVRVAHAHGLTVSVWTVSKRDGFLRFIEGGADNITTKDVRELTRTRSENTVDAS